MRKLLALLLMILLALASVAAYLLINKTIADGETRIAKAQSRLEGARPKLGVAKAKLEAGTRELAKGEEDYDQAKGNLFLKVADKLLRGGKGFKEARERIAAGDQQVASGEGKLKAGARRLQAGEVALRLAKEQLREAKLARVASAAGAALFAAVSIVLGVCWRRSLGRISAHADAADSPTRP